MQARFPDPALTFAGVHLCRRSPVIAKHAFAGDVVYMYIDIYIYVYIYIFIFIDAEPAFAGGRPPLQAESGHCKARLCRRCCLYVYIYI